MNCLTKPGKRRSGDVGQLKRQDDAIGCKRPGTATSEEGYGCRYGSRGEGCHLFISTNRVATP